MLINLSKLRQLTGVTQSQLGDIVGVSQQSINKYENHNVEPDLATLMKLADFFEVSVDYLIGHEFANDVREEKETYHVDKNIEDKILLKNYHKLDIKTKKNIFNLLRDVE